MEAFLGVIALSRPSLRERTCHEGEGRFRENKKERKRSTKLAPARGPTYCAAASFVVVRRYRDAVGQQTSSKQGIFTQLGRSVVQCHVTSFVDL